MTPSVSAVVVSHNTRDELLCCLQSIRDHAGQPVEIVVVDNASRDDSVEAVTRSFPQARLLPQTDNLGFGRANNLGIAAAQAPNVLLLNSDAELRPGALEALATALQSHPELALVGPRTVDSEGIIEVSFGPALTPVAEWHQRRLVKGVQARQPGALRQAEERARIEHQPDWLSASCWLARKQALQAVGGFDEGFFLYEEDVDLCLRLRRAGFGLLFAPTAEIIHHRGRSMRQASEMPGYQYQRSHLRYYRKHLGPFWTLLLRARLLASGAAQAVSRSEANRVLGRRLLRLALLDRP